MKTIERSIIIKCPVESVFQYIADFKNYPKWQHSILDCKKASEGLIGVGTIFETKMIYMKKRYTSPLQIVEYELNKKIVFCVNKFGIFKWFKGTFNFEKVNNSTKVTIHAQTDVVFPFKPLLFLVSLWGRYLWSKHLDKLKNILEAKLQG
jgi:uncharacterized protein YndB with AHSA1/START domain